MADVTEEYKLQVRQACNRGFSLGWMSLLKRLYLPTDSPFHNADAIPLPFPLLRLDLVEDNNDDEALVRKCKDAAEAKSLPSIEQVINLTQDKEGGEVEEVSQEAVPG